MCWREIITLYLVEEKNRKKKMEEKSLYIYIYRLLDRVENKRNENEKKISFLYLFEQKSKIKNLM